MNSRSRCITSPIAVPIRVQRPWYGGWGCISFLAPRNFSYSSRLSVSALDGEKYGCARKLKNGRVRRAF
ncbi:hypothetical protein O0536_25605, partial [Brevibacillus laterosporus]|uniref:hypothetical protein n=1 Tax=Brevibacillus laterosporus TaxID=1465 RepID=UPI0022A693E0